MHIGFDVVYARKFLSVPQVSFNIFLFALLNPYGAKFLRDVRKAERSIFLWTVNDEHWMMWSIKKGVDGVVTDDPKRFLEVCRKFERGEKVAPGPWKSTLVWRLVSYVFVVVSFCLSPWVDTGIWVMAKRKRQLEEAEKKALLA